jgi:hypothetical protein
MPYSVLLHLVLVRLLSVIKASSSWKCLLLVSERHGKKGTEFVKIVKLLAGPHGQRCRKTTQSYEEMKIKKK